MPDLGALLEFNVSCVSEFTQRAGRMLSRGEPYVAQLRAELAQTKASCLPRCVRSQDWKCRIRWRNVPLSAGRGRS